MLVLSEETVVLDGVAQSQNLICDLILLAVTHTNGVGDASVLSLVFQEELHGARVLVQVLLAPLLRDRTLPLEGSSTKVNILRLHSEFISGESLFRVQRKQAANRDATNTPVLRVLGHTLDRDSHAGQTSLNESASSIAHSGTKGAVEERGVARATLVTEEMGHGSE